MRTHNDTIELSDLQADEDGTNAAILETRMLAEKTPHSSDVGRLTASFQSFSPAKRYSKATLEQ